MRQIFLLALTMAAITTGATAHSGVENTTPANEATVEAVEAIEIRFDEPMRVASITLTGPDGDIELERETGMDAVMEFRALPPTDLPAGAYTVEWRGLSADGHPMSGTFVFSVTD
ncbi:copper resistance protein CopC [Roseobacter sp. HKCCA0434]|uniref:copper resistance CopC family protein n=1 Tax=Roseobacter sp. HKCCA0434 TaxID=3079297 RepID=UPI002905C50F|nr:copper resistance protein CopC [Roseobacter sp. HKCCA0434]